MLKTKGLRFLSRVHLMTMDLTLAMDVTWTITLRIIWRSRSFFQIEPLIFCHKFENSGDIYIDIWSWPWPWGDFEGYIMVKFIFQLKFLFFVVNPKQIENLKTEYSFNRDLDRYLHRILEVHIIVKSFFMIYRQNTNDCLSM